MMNSNEILSYLMQVGIELPPEMQIKILIIGGAAGMLTGEFAAARTTMDCDVIHYDPGQGEAEVLAAAERVAQEFDLPVKWLNSEAKKLDILPAGWEVRKVAVSSSGPLTVYALSRQDLLATKFYAGSPRDVEDILAMVPNLDELYFAERYLHVLRVPSRQANLDSVSHGLKLLKAIREGINE